jgi:hypothetical protein
MVRVDRGARVPARCHDLVGLVVWMLTDGRSDLAVGVSVQWQHVVHACGDSFLIHCGDTRSDTGLFDRFGWNRMSGLLCIGCANSLRVLGITLSIPIRRTVRISPPRAEDDSPTRWMGIQVVVKCTP